MSACLLWICYVSGAAILLKPSKQRDTIIKIAGIPGLLKDRWHSLSISARNEVCAGMAHGIDVDYIVDMQGSLLLH